MKNPEDEHKQYLSILHISDLHRNPEQHVSNEALLNSLKYDLNRYTSGVSAIQKPNLIIVSGDLVKGLDNDEPVEKIDLQYEEAANFLSKLAEVFLNGNKEKIIIAPGNHDVCWYYSRKSMKNVPINDRNMEEKRSFVKKLMQGDSSIRWSWDSCEFFRIEDQSTYRQGLKPFSDFYAKFYDGKRHFSLDPSKQYDIFDYSDLNITAVSFNSCFNNDHCNTIGKIHPDCISQSIRELYSSQYLSRLRIAVWHHNIKGLPMEADFMDSRCVMNLIEAGFSIGFHGHQHESGMIEERLSYSSGNKCFFISVGTLCGNKYELPFGTSRQYNIVIIDPAKMEATIHVREMKNNNPELPIWGQGNLGMENQSFLTVTLKKSDVQTKREKTVDMFLKTISEAENYIGNKKYDQALPILNKLDPKNEIVRRLIIECYLNLRNNKGIINLCDPPQNDAEIIYCFDALWEEQEIEKLKPLLTSENVANSQNKLVRDAKDKYIKRLEARKV